MIDAAYDTLPATGFCAETRAATTERPPCSRPEPSGRLFPPLPNLNQFLPGQRSLDERQVDRFGHALASIWRMRSRFTENRCAASPRV